MKSRFSLYWKYHDNGSLDEPPANCRPPAEMEFGVIRNITKADSSERTKVCQKAAFVGNPAFYRVTGSKPAAGKQTGHLYNPSPRTWL